MTGCEVGSDPSVEFGRSLEPRETATKRIETERSLSVAVERRLVSDRRESSGKAAFVRALNVRRNAALGLAVGVAVAVAVFVGFVLRPETSRSPLLYVALAFVLAVSLGGLVATVLTLGSAIRLARAE